jgi:shikimate kinase / 3-dehydroquinate synthase
MYPWDGKNIYFIGFMATGKSKVGSEFAKIIGWPFCDTDDLIEDRAGKTISEIFEKDGEPVFRKFENDIIAEYSEKKHNIISLGGGAVMSDLNWQLVCQSGLTICLHAALPVLHERIKNRDHRPLLNSLADSELLDKITKMLKIRESRYLEAEYKFESKKEVLASDLANTIFEILRDEI